VPVAPTSEKRRINDIIATLRQQVLPLLKAEKYDDAKNILKNYNGELADETKEKRMQLIAKIDATVAKINGEAGDGEKNRVAAPASDTKTSPAAILKKVCGKFAPLLFKGKIQEAATMLEVSSATAEGTVKNILASFLTQINNYEKLRPQLENKTTADPIIKSPDNQQIMEKAFLLQGLLYKDKEQFVRAKQSFMKMPMYLGDIFVGQMEQSLRDE